VTLLPLLSILFLFLFLFLLLHANGVVVSHLFPAAVISVEASSVTTAIVLGAIVLQMETKMVPTTTTVATANKMCHGMPSTPPSNPHPKESKGGGHHCGSWW
jgi:hypothetical protein